MKSKKKETKLSITEQNSLLIPAKGSLLLQMIVAISRSESRLLEI
jgi:hypothetical protein